MIRIQVLILILLTAFTLVLQAQKNPPEDIDKNITDALQSVQLEINKASILSMAVKLDILQNTLNDAKVEISNLKGIGVGFGSCFMVLQGLMVFFQFKKK